MARVLSAIEREPNQSAANDDGNAMEIVDDDNEPQNDVLDTSSTSGDSDSNESENDEQEVDYEGEFCFVFFSFFFF